MLVISDATGLNRFNIKFFRLQHQKDTRLLNLLYNLVPILHIHYRFMKLSVWLI